MKKNIQITFIIVVAPSALKNINITIKKIRQNISNLKDIYVITSIKNIKHKIHA